MGSRVPRALRGGWRVWSVGDAYGCPRRSLGGAGGQRWDRDRQDAYRVWGGERLKEHFWSVNAQEPSSPEESG